MSYACALVGISYIFMHMHYCISFRCAKGTRVDVKHAVLESTHKTVFDGSRQKMEGPAEATKDPAQGLNSINTDLVLPLEFILVC